MGHTSEPSTEKHLLPAYIYDLIAAVQQHEDEHADTADCFDALLHAIPEQERDRAAAIAAYRRESMPTLSGRAPRARCQLTPVVDPDAVHAALGELFQGAVDYNRKYGLKQPTEFRLNRDDAERLGCAGVHAAVVNDISFKGVISIPVVADAAVPSRWLQIVADDEQRFTSLTLLPKAPIPAMPADDD